jgi:hypothetical protein
LLIGEAIMAKVQKSTDSSSLAEVVDRILDKGIVIDAWVKVSLVGIELLSIEARVVNINTWLGTLKVYQVFLFYLQCFTEL